MSTASYFAPIASDAHRLGRGKRAPVHDPCARPHEPAIQLERGTVQLEIEIRDDGHCAAASPARRPRAGATPASVMPPGPAHTLARYPGEYGMRFLRARQMSHELDAAGREPPEHAQPNTAGVSARSPGPARSLRDQRCTR